MICPVITIDGPSGTGKGTVARMLAKQLKWHLLDSGMLYRVLAEAAKFHQIEPEDEAKLTEQARNLDVQFIDNDNDITVILDGQDVTCELRSEECGELASKISSLKEVRAALLEWQRGFAKMPGLVTDGRDMGTVVFPEAAIKFFLDAELDERAKRRAKQLQGRGINVTLARVLDDLKARDERDRNRSFAPLKAAPDAILVDTTDMSVEDVYRVLINEVNMRLSEVCRS